MDQQMYWNMTKFAKDPVIDRGIALHKMIRLITFALAGEAYLTFIGNEFGHPEWVDFPRPDNGFSHHYARRQWSLIEQTHLRYHELRDFDKAMLALDPEFDLLNDPLIEQLALHEDSRQVIFRRGPLVFAFNFHVSESYAGLRIPVPDRADYGVILDTDADAFGGKGLLSAPLVYPWQDVPMYGRQQSLQIYLPARSAQVLAPASKFVTKREDY
jgi:1,4-alpha-glucan branching enzyme